MKSPSIMVKLTDLISKKKKSGVEELFSEISEESKIFEEFLMLHREKVDNAQVNGLIKFGW